MVSIEEVSLYVGIISGLVIPVVFFFMVRHLKNSDSTSSKATYATFNIGTMDKRINDIADTLDEQNKHFDKRIDGLMNSMEKRDERWRADLNKVWERIDAISTDSKLHEYRLNKLDRTNESGNHRQ